MEPHTASDKAYIEIAVGLCVLLEFPVEYKFLKYVDLGQFARRLWTFLYSSLILSAVILVGSFLWGLLPSIGGDSVAPFFRSFPNFVWVIVFIAYFSWSIRGKVFTFPKMDWEQWLVFNIAVGSGIGIGAFAVESLPDPGGLCVIVILVNALITYSDLIETGKSNYESQTARYSPH